MKFLDRPETKVDDPCMFGKDWWLQPLPARFASIDAHQAGLLVQVEVVKRSTANDSVACITWRGTPAQFQATKYFSKGVRAKRSSGRFVHPAQLRGTVYPDGEDRFLFVIEFCCIVSTGQRLAKRAKAAMTDNSYLRFRESLLNTTINEQDEPK